MDRQQLELQAKITATNNANKFANELHPKLAAIFKLWVGTPIIKADGSLSARVAKLIQEFPSSPKLNVYRYTSDYSLTWVVRTCEEANGHAHYAECSVCVGELSGTVLRAMSKPYTHKTDYTLAQVLANRKAAQEAKTTYEKARDACYPFAE